MRNLLQEGDMSAPPQLVIKRERDRAIGEASGSEAILENCDLEVDGPEVRAINLLDKSG